MNINGLQINAARLLSHLFPSACRLCSAAAEPLQLLCPACLKDLPWLKAACLRCGLPLAYAAGQCGQCQRQPPAFDHTLALFQYRPPLDFLVKRLKFSGELAMCRFFSQLLAGRIASAQAEIPDLIVPVPLHPCRLRQRGFNQSTEIARRLGRALDVGVDPGLCQRTRDTRPQSLLPRAERGRNIQGAFRVRGALPGTRIALIDDVMTSGHTCHELALTLKRAGAQQVLVWVIARAGQATGRG